MRHGTGWQASSIVPAVLLAGLLASLGAAMGSAASDAPKPAPSPVPPAAGAAPSAAPAPGAAQAPSPEGVPAAAVEAPAPPPRIIRTVCTDHVCGSCDGKCRKSSGHVAVDKKGHCACTPTDGSPLDKATRQAYEKQRPE